MKKLLTIKMEGFHINDLSPAAREVAVHNTASFWIELSDQTDADYKRIEEAIDEANRLRTPHFLQAIVAEKYEDLIIEELDQYEYLFTEDGSIIPLRYLYHRDNNGELAEILYDGKHQVTIEDHKTHSEGDAQQ